MSAPNSYPTKNRVPRSRHGSVVRQRQPRFKLEYAQQAVTRAVQLSLNWRGAPRLTVYEIKNGWAKIKVYGQIGYVSAEYSPRQNRVPAAANRRPTTRMTNRAETTAAMSSRTPIRAMATTDSRIQIPVITTTDPAMNSPIRTPVATTMNNPTVITINESRG